MKAGKRMWIGFALAALPILASAQVQGTKVQDILAAIKNIMDLLIPIFVTLGLLYFIYGLAEYILSSGDSEKMSDGRNKMIFGVVALFVMVAVWGLVGVIQRTFGVNVGGQIQIPTVPNNPYSQ